MIPRDVSEREAIWQVQVRRMRVGLSAANVIGALTVFVFLRLLVPIPSTVRHDTAFLWLNAGLFALVGVVATAVANVWGPRSANEIRRWFLSGTVPDARQRERTLRQPLVQTKIDAVLWLSAGAVFVTVNAFKSTTIAVQAAVGITLGGLASCALTYLLAERFTREVTVAALAGGPPERPVGPSVGDRLLVAWGLAAAIPLLGGALLAISVLTVGHWSASREAVSLLLVTGIGLALGFVAMRIAGRSVVEPIEVVREALRRVQRGDLSAEIPGIRRQRDWSASGRLQRNDRRTPRPRTHS